MRAPGPERAQALNFDDDRLVILGWDLQNTHRRRAAWRYRVWAVWGVTALPVTGALAWFLHPGFTSLGVMTFLLPLRADALPASRWTLPAASAVWVRITAGPPGVCVDHLFGLGVPPLARVLDPDTSVDVMNLGLRVQHLAWEDVDPIELDGNVLLLGDVRIRLDGVTPEELAAGVDHLRALAQRHAR